MNILGISANYHDSAACLFVKDRLVFACEEEKFSRIKHDHRFPWQCISYIMEHFTSEIDTICYYEMPSLKTRRAFRYGWKGGFHSLMSEFSLCRDLKKISKQVVYSTHHESHQAWSYFTSPFEQATVISVDGVGEFETLSVSMAKGTELKCVHSVKYPHSLGLFYSAITAFLGFRPNEGEYKVMGLASYGDPAVFRRKFDELAFFRDGLEINLNFFEWHRSRTKMFNHKLGEFFGVQNRLPNEPIEEVHMHLAAALQAKYEELFFTILLKYKGENLCLGGGCAYNATANGKIQAQTHFKNLWIPAAPSDAGSAIGACLHYNKLKIILDPFLGPTFPEFEIPPELKPQPLSLSKLASLINEGKIVGWFQGKIEFGARALGNRSIIASPSIQNMKDKLNKVIKKRESFRPFAPIVAYDKQHLYFNTQEYIPFMSITVNVRQEFVDKLPAVVHVDGTARVQSVKPGSLIYQLLMEFEKVSGYPMLLNTSFNIDKQPIVLTPEQAIENFVNTELDILVIDGSMICKS